MPLIDGLLQELEQEAATTRRVLQRVPDAKLTWKPHAKAASASSFHRGRRMTPPASTETVLPEKNKEPGYGTGT